MAWLLWLPLASFAQSTSAPADAVQVEAAASPASPPATASSPTTARAADPEEGPYLSIIKYLASPELNGRKTGQKGNQLAADFLSDRFDNAGLKKIGSSWFHGIGASSRVTVWAGEGAAAHRLENASLQALGRSVMGIRNVLAVLPGEGPLADEAIIVGAHFDHIGGRDDGEYYPGANDNASGTAGMVLLAEWFSRRQSADELPHNRRTLLFAAFDGEEQGLLGSCYLVTRLGSLPWKIAGMLNLDCIGRAPIDGFCCVNTWPEGLLKRLSDDAGLTYSPMAALPESDFWPFYHIGVPVLMFWDDNLRAIHRVSDTWDMIDARRALRIVRVADRAVQDALTDDQFKAQARPRLGLSLIGETNKVSAVADLSPAADAGISAGDVIQSVAGQAVSNRDEFRQASEAVKDRSSFEVVLLRRKQTLAVTLQPGLDGPSSMPTPATAPADAVEAK